MDYETGDIFLFSGNYLVSEAIEFIIHNKWTHVSMVVKNPDFLMNTPKKDGLYLYESDGVELPDVDTGDKLLGVQLVDLQERINTYKGCVCYRKLNWNKTEDEKHSILKTVYNTTFHKTYDWNIINLIEPMIYKKYWILDKLFYRNSRRTDAFFCSALMAYVYTQFGIMKNDTLWDTIYPQYFAENTNYEDGASLGDIVVVKNK